MGLHKGIHLTEAVSIMPSEFPEICEPLITPLKKKKCLILKKIKHECVACIQRLFSVNLIRNYLQQEKMLESECRVALDK